MLTVLQDARAALRTWIRRPLMPLLAILVLAFGLAAGTSVFAIVDATLWRPLPLPSPASLVWIESIDSGVADGTAPGVFTAWSDRARTLDSIAALWPAQRTVRDGAGDPERVAGAFVTPAALQVLGISPARGRGFEQAAGADRTPVVAISDRLWRSRYQAAEDIIGREVLFDGSPRTIVAVLPPVFSALPPGYDWLAPLALPAAQRANVGPRYLDVIARAPHASFADVERELTALAASAGARGDTGAPLGVRVQALQSVFSAGPSRLLLPLLVAVIAVVLIAAVNAASLLLSFAHTRRSEIAIRASLGATRPRIVALLLLESAWLVAAATAMSFLVAQWMLDGLRALLPIDAAPLAAAALDRRAVGFTLVMAAVVTAVSSIAPAFRAAASPHALSGVSRALISSPDRLRRSFVVLQVAAAVALAIAGGLMWRTSQALGASTRGYDERVVTATLQFGSRDYPSAASLRAAIDRVVGAAASVTGVERAALATRAPLTGGSPGVDAVLAGEAFTPGVDRQARVRFVTPGYFDAVGTPILAGRDIAAGDTSTAPLVVLVNLTLARRLGGERDLVGRELTFGVRDFDVNGPRTTWRVVGIVADTRDRGPRASVEPEAYLAAGQGPADVFDWIGRQAVLAIRLPAGSPLDVSRVRSAIAKAEPGLALFDVRTLGERLQASMAVERTLTTVLVPLAVCGIGLSMFGLFTLFMQSVLERQRELAVRIALGATSGRILGGLLREGAGMALLGMGLGVVAAVPAGQALGTVVFGVTPLDVPTYAAVAAIVLATSAVALWLPARRALATDPARLLR